MDTKKINPGTSILMGFSILYLPQLFLALMTTLDKKISSLNILRYHPSLIMLPVFTFFTFSKNSNFCRGSESMDSRVMFSLKYTKINMGISLASYVIFCYVMKYTILTESDIYKNYYDLFYWTNFLLFVFTVILAISFLYLENFYWFCCDCFLDAKQEIFVHDPLHPDKTFKLVNKQIIEIHEETEVKAGIGNAINDVYRGTLEIVGSKNEDIEMRPTDNKTHSR